MQLLMRGISLSLLLLLIACGVRQTAEELWSLSGQQIQTGQYDRAIKVLETLVDAYPEHPLAPIAQFQIGEIYMNSMDDLPSGLDAFEETTIRYPETDEGVKALFMIGYINANHTGDYELARKAYTDFLNRYPNHELIPSVEFELENLGKAVEEIDAIKNVRG